MVIDFLSFIIPSWLGLTHVMVKEAPQTIQLYVAFWVGDEWLDGCLCERLGSWP